MACAFAGIAEGTARHGYEFPAIFSGGETQLQDAVGFVVADFTVRCGVAERCVAAAAGADDDFADAVFGVGIAFWILWGEAFVGVFVSRKDEVGARVVQILPEGA